MTCLNVTPPASGTVLALLVLPQPLTAQTLLELEQAIVGTLARQGRDPAGAGDGLLPGRAAGGPDAAEIEYASWMPDPGALEVASWAAHVRACLR